MPWVDRSRRWAAPGKPTTFMTVLHNLEVARLRGLIDALRRRAGDDPAWRIIEDAVSQELNGSKYRHEVLQTQASRRVDHSHTARS